MFIVFCFFAIPYSLSAQAWLFPKGEGTVTFSYQDTYVLDHVDYKGQPWSLFGAINSQSLTVDTDYSLTNKLAVRVALPYVFGKYDGQSQYAHSFPVDDGKYHSTLQNFTADLRYNVSQRPVVFTPFVRLVMPSHNYQYFAHAAVGRDVREYHIGINVGRRLDRVLPKAFVQAQYSYAFVQRILNISPNRSNVEAQLGYFLTPRLSLLASTQWYHSYEGLEAHFELPPPGGLTEEQWRRHDQLAKASLLDVTGGVSFAMNRKVEMFASFGRSITGTNGHLHASVITVGVSRTFGTARKEESAALGLGGMPPPNQAIVCTCARGN
jgi:hypothetical protein